MAQTNIRRSKGGKYTMPINNDDGNTIVVVEGTLKHTTTKATLLTVGGFGGKEFWFPNSQMKKASVLIDEENGEWAIFVPKWLMKDKENCQYDEYDPEDWPAHTVEDPDDDIPF